MSTKEKRIINLYGVIFLNNHKRYDFQDNKSRFLNKRNVSMMLPHYLLLTICNFRQ